MTNSWVTPPEADFPSGRLAVRRDHLVAEIEATAVRASRPAFPWRARLAAAGALALAIVAVVVGLGPGGPAGPSVAQATIDVVVSDGFYEIRFVELAPGVDVVEQELEALGLHVGLDFVPVSPSLVGRLVASSGGGAGEVYAVEPGGVPSLRIPLGYEAALDLTIGRPGLAGEDYVSSPALGAEAPGEALHCSGVFNMAVADAERVLAERGLTAEWRTVDRTVVARPTGFVVNTTPKRAGEVIMWTAPQPLPADVRPAHVVEFLAGGCG